MHILEITKHDIPVEEQNRIDGCAGIEKGSLVATAGGAVGSIIERVINAHGQSKILFETDYPVIDFKHAVEELEELEFRETAKRRLLVENAARVYHLED